MKKVVIRPFDGDPSWGYLPASGFLRDGRCDLVGVDGRSISFEMKDIKLVAYVKDFNVADAADPERIGQRVFPSRPRGAGLWTRLGFRDGDLLDCIAQFDLVSLDEFPVNSGIFAVPGDTRSNTQRIFVPRSSLTSLEVLGFTPPRRPARKLPRPADPNQQTELFGE